MYRLGTAGHFGPGTGVIEQWRGNLPGGGGLGAYVGTQNYALTPAGQAGIRGLGCGCRGIGCACDQGMGLFESGMDYTQWGPGEWAIVVLGGYMVFSTLFTTRRAARAATRKGKAVRRALAA
jgi:hypothetical protein